MQLQDKCCEILEINSKKGHVCPGLPAKKFRKIAPNGFGDPYNAYPHSMTWFQDSLYVGTTRANLANRGKQVARTSPERVGEIWPVKMPNNYFDNDLRAQIWRYHPPSDIWSKVFISPVVKGIDGYDVPISVGFRCMTSFQGSSDAAPALYIPTWGSHQTPATLMLRSVDGSAFEVVSEPGLGVPDPKPRGLRGLVSFKGHLFASSVVGQSRLEPNIAGFMLIYVSSDPARGNWRLACEPHFGNPNNLSVFDMAPFNGYLYAGTLNINEGFQIWKTDADGEPPFTWKKVLTHGAYRGKLNQIAMTLIPFKDHLYVGSAIQNCSFDFSNKVGPAPPEVLRINPDDSWELIVGEPRITPDGLKVPLSGLGPGFGNHFSGYLWSMCEHEGWLYAATAVWAVFLRYAGREKSWPKELRSIFTRENVERILLRFGGCDLWRTRDGYHWIPVTQNGFENCFNIGFRNMVSSPYGLFVGAANPFAPQVAVRRVAGWTYENNPKGGLEIWLGSHNQTVITTSPDSLKIPQQLMTERQSIENESEEGDRGSPEEIISKFFGESDFRHFGFWRIDIQDTRRACENLMDEILAFIPQKRGTIVDIGCGPGATTRYLLKHFTPEAVTGITTNRRFLKTCREKATQVNFLQMKLPNLKLQSESFDFVIWVKGFDRLGPRQKLLQESFRILKPGGQLVCFDVLYLSATRKSLWEQVRTFSDSVKTPDEYRALLLSNGFQDIQLADVTAECIESFRKHRLKYFGLKKLSGEIDDTILKEIESHFLTAETQISQCLLISACKSAIGFTSPPETKSEKRRKP